MFRNPADRPQIFIVVVLSLAVTTLVCCNSRNRDDDLPSGKAPESPPESRRKTLPSSRSAVGFQSRTAESGMMFTYRNGEESGQFAIIESLGGGVSLFDYDGDGRLDVFVPGGGKFEGKNVLGCSPALFRNESIGSVGGKWVLQDVTVSAKADAAPYYSHGAAAGDFDNDGFPDVAVTGYGGLVLFRNMGDGTFSDQARELGLNDTLWSSSAAWGDLNGDGNLDLFVVHYVNWSWSNHPVCRAPNGKSREVCPPRRYQPLPDTLYISNGDGTFRDESVKTGLKAGKGLGVVLADFNLSGRLDVYVTNDTEPNFLYRNTGKGFKEVGLSSGTSRGDAGTADGSMGTDAGDFDGDGLIDLWVANYESEAHALYRNDGNYNFTHVSQGTGVTALGGLYVGWGSVFLDFDRDGDEDIFVSNGHVIRHPLNAPLKQKPVLLENRNGKRFVNVAAQVGDYFRNDHMGRGVAVGDIDNDGDQDLVVVHTNEPVALLSNETKNDNGWLSVRLVGTTSSRDPIGAVLFLETTTGKLMRQVKGGGSYASTSDPRVFFGLGISKIKRLEIRWPSGRKQFVDKVTPNQLMTIVEPR